MATLFEDLDYGNKNIMKINSSKQITKHFNFNLPCKICTRLLKDPKGILSDLKICENEVELATPWRFICAPETTLASISCALHLLPSNKSKLTHFVDIYNLNEQRRFLFKF